MKENFIDLYGELLIHDFSTIFQNIKSSIELSSYNLEKLGVIEDFIQIINHQVSRGFQLISNLQYLSKLPKSKKNIQSVNAHIILNKSISFIESAFQESELKIDVDYALPNITPTEGIYVQANSMLRNVFENILFNAIHYNRSSCVEIMVIISREKLNEIQFIKLEFIDNGIGIIDTQREIIFQNGHEKHKGGRGMGLGLTLVKKLIERYKGYIWVEDKVKGDYSKGSNFVILIPETT